MTKKKTEAEKRLAKIKAIFIGPKKGKVSYDVYYNLMGPVLDYQYDGAFDRASYRTIKRVLEKLGKIRRILVEDVRHDSSRT